MKTIKEPVKYTRKWFEFHWPLKVGETPFNRRKYGYDSIEFRKEMLKAMQEDIPNFTLYQKEVSRRKRMKVLTYEDGNNM